MVQNVAPDRLKRADFHLGRQSILDFRCRTEKDLDIHDPQENEHGCAQQQQVGRIQDQSYAVVLLGSVSSVIHVLAHFFSFVAGLSGSRSGDPICSKVFRTVDLRLRVATSNVFS